MWQSKAKPNLKSSQQMFDTTVGPKPHKHGDEPVLCCRKRKILLLTLARHFSQVGEIKDPCYVAHWQPLRLTSAWPLCVWGMLAAIHASQPLAGTTTTTTTAASPAAAGDDRGAFLSALGSWRSFLAKKTYPKHLQQSEQRGEGKEVDVGGGGGRRRGGEGWWLEGWWWWWGRGAEMWGRRAAAAAEVRLRCKKNLTRTFERLNPKESAAASACCTTNRQSWDRLGFYTGGAPPERRENNYNDNLCLLYLTKWCRGKIY